VRYIEKKIISRAADFKDAAIDEEKLSIELKDGGANNVPHAAKSKSELMEKLKKGRVSPFFIQHGMIRSILPD